MKRIFLLLMFPFSLLGQEEEESTSFFGSMFISHGIQLGYTNFFTSPEFTFDSNINPLFYEEIETFTITEAYSGTNVFTYEMGIRKNLFELDDDASISFGAYPAICLTMMFTYDDYLLGLGGLKLPLYLEYNIGIGSTFYSEMDEGRTFGIGVDLRYMPIKALESNVFSSFEATNLNVTKGYYMVSAKYGWRKYSKKGNLNEISGRLGVSLTPYESALGQIGEIASVDRPMSFELTFSRFIKY
jgi:hypothetical protein